MSAKDPKGIRESVLKAALPEIEREGFNESVLARAGKKAGFKPIEVQSAFPHSAASLVEEFSHWADARMASRMKNSKAKGMTARITAAVRARIEAMVPHKEAARRAAAFLALPNHAALGMKLLYRSVDAIWRAAGDRATDFSFYTKRATLSGVYGATLLYWLGDESEGAEATWKFLGHRIKDVMSFEKFKKTAREAMEKLPDPLGFFAAWRGRPNA
jgi:ubiquinone biosynthesis protein COQ9